MAKWVKNKVRQLAKSLAMTPKEAKEFGDHVNRILHQSGLNSASFEDISRAAGTLTVNGRTPDKVAKALRGDNERNGYSQSVSPSQIKDSSTFDTEIGSARILLLMPASQEMVYYSAQVQAQALEPTPQLEPQEHPVFTDLVSAQGAIQGELSNRGFASSEPSDATSASSPLYSHQPNKGVGVALDDAWEEAKANLLGRTLYPEHEPEFAPPPIEEPWYPASKASRQTPKDKSFSSSRIGDSQTEWSHTQRQQAKQFPCLPSIETTVRGVRYEGRQNVVACLEVGEILLLRRELKNPHDRNAIRVERQNGAQVGYIPREIAAEIAATFERIAGPVQAVVTAVHGRNYSAGYLGVRIRFVAHEGLSSSLPSLDDIEPESDQSV